MSHTLTPSTLTVDSEKPPHPDVSRPPSPHKEAQTDGGRAAWMTLAGSWAMLFATFGYASAFGVYQDFYTRAGTASASRVSWIGSVQIFFMVLVGLPAGRLFERGYFRHVIGAGSVLFTFSVFMLSLADPTKYYQVFLAQGPAMGIGAGLMYMPALTVQAHHWKQHRALAMGVVMTGTSAGAIVWSIMLNHLMPKGFAWAVRYSGFIILALLLFANAVMSPGPSHAHEHDDSVTVKRIVTDPPFVMGVLGLTLALMGVYFPYFYLQLTAIQHGVSPRLAFYIIAIMNALSIPGRIAAGRAADKFGTFNVVVPATLLCGGLTFVMLAVKDAAGALVVAVLFGIASGGFFALLGPVPAALTRKPSEFGLRMSLTFGITSFGTLAGTPIDGALVSGTHYLKPVVFSASMFFGATVLLGCARMIMAREKGTWRV